ncbi:MAG TPA: formyltetrahydrofolate deformylase [Kiritimatiellae bacterium]|nr:formyltetrahydrofolate deformylase [Kiritimatiellia bacterium]
MTRKEQSESAVLLISCPDRKGIDAAVTRFIAENDGNIIHLDQHVDFERDWFFMRIEWELEGFALPREAIGDQFRPIAGKFHMEWSLRFSSRVPRMAVFVSRLPHCLYDLLARWKSGEWKVEIPLVISNHSHLEAVASSFGVPFHVFPITPQNKESQEREELRLLRAAEVDLIVLARYMQVLTPVLVDAYPNRIINIHHSFLPAFPGSRPYHSAYARGVKVIGATSHYVTRELDAGPIIEQDIIRVSHKDTVADLVRKGRDLEKLVLARAVWYHLQHRVLVYGNKTVVFD